MGVAKRIGETKCVSLANLLRFGTRSLGSCLWWKLFRFVGYCRIDHNFAGESYGAYR